MMIVKNIFDNCPLQELQQLLQLKKQQQQIVFKYLNKVAPSAVIVKFYEGQNSEQISFTENNIIPPEIKNFLANLHDRLSGEIWILEEVVDEKTKLN